MSFLKAVGGLFVGAAEAVAGGATAVWHAITAVYTFAATVFDLVGSAWDWMVNGLKWLGDTTVGALAGLLHLAEWTLLHAIPEGLAWAWHQAEHAALAAVHTAVRFLESLVHTVRHALEAALHQLEAWARAAFNWVAKLAGEAWTWVSNTGARLANLVLHPERLVQWILAALVLPLLRFLIESSAPVLVWLFRAFEREAYAFAKTIENVLAKVI